MCSSAKSKKKSVVPSFVLLEKSPLKVVDFSSVVGRAVPSVVEEVVSSSLTPTGSFPETESTRRRTRSDVVKYSSAHDPNHEESVAVASDAMPSTPIPSVLREDVHSGHDGIENIPEPTSSRISVVMSNLGTEGYGVSNEVEGRTRSRSACLRYLTKNLRWGKS